MGTKKSLDPIRIPDLRTREEVVASEKEALAAVRELSQQRDDLAAEALRLRKLIDAYGLDPTPPPKMLRSLEEIQADLHALIGDDEGYLNHPEESVDEVMAALRGCDHCDRLQEVIAELRAELDAARRALHCWTCKHNGDDNVCGLASVEPPNTETPDAAVDEWLEDTPLDKDGMPYTALDRRRLDPCPGWEWNGWKAEGLGGDKE